MPELITRLKVDSTEYDAKIKRAAQGVQHFVKSCHDNDEVIGRLLGNTRKYVESIGQMETVSTTAKGRLNELTAAFTDLRSVYNSLSEEEKNAKGGFGQELNKQLEILKGRINDTKSELKGISTELNGTGGFMDALTSKLTVNIDAMKLFNVGLQAAGAALDVAKDAFFASEQNVDEWGRTVQSTQSLYEGFLNAINNGDISGYLGRMDEIVKAAREAYNEMDRLGTMQTIQKPQMSQKQAEMDRYRAMLQTGRWIGAADGRKSALGYKEGDIMSKEHLKIIEQQLQSGMNELVGFHKNEVQQQTKAIDAEYKSMATDLGMSLEEFRKGTSSMAKFDEMMAGYNEYKKWDAQAKTEFAKQGGRGFVDFDKSNPFAEYRKWGTFRVDGERYNRLADFIQQRDQHMSQMYQMQGQTYRTINRAEGTTVRSIMGGGGSGTGTSPQEQAQKQVEAALLAYNQTIEKANMALESGRIDDTEVKKRTLAAQEQLWSAYGKAYNTYADPKYKEAQDAAAAEIVKLGGEVKTATEAQKLAEQAAREQEAAAKKLAAEQEKLADTYAEAATAAADNNLKGFLAANKKAEGMGGQAVEMPVTFTATSSNIDAFVGHLKEQLATADVGSELFNKLTAQAADATAMKNVIEMAMKRGVEMSVIDPSGLWKKVFTDNPGDYIDDKTWEKLQQTINEKLAEMGIEPIKIDLQTGNLVQAGNDINKVSNNFRDASQAISAVGSALNSIEDPGAKVAGIVAQAIATVASSFASALHTDGTTKSNIWAFIAAAAASTASMITMIDSIHSATGYANGGIVKADGGAFVPGNSMSGDMVPAMLNSGELVLNRAQQGNLAAQLEGGVGQRQQEIRLSGEDIYISLSNYLNRSGYGEIVTSH